MRPNGVRRKFPESVSVSLRCRSTTREDSVQPAFIVLSRAFDDRMHLRLRLMSYSFFPTTHVQSTVVLELFTGFSWTNPCMIVQHVLPEGNKEVCWNSSFTCLSCL